MMSISVMDQVFDDVYNVIQQIVEPLLWCNIFRQHVPHSNVL